MRARALAAVVSAGMLAMTLSGCVTVHGETALVPAVGKAEARKVLRHFTATNNQANRSLDAGLNATIEAGALGAIDQAGLRARQEVHPEGDPEFEELRLSDARFLIPEQAGWPKFFVADVLSNRGTDGRWFLAFQRNAADAPWKATYLAVVDPASLPEFAVGGNGRLEAVPLHEDADLAITPDRLSETYTRYLQDGTGADFAPGPHTTEWRAQREKTEEQLRVRYQYADQPAEPPQFTPFGLRTKDGGALVFFASHHHQMRTVAKGYKPEISDPYVEAMITGTPRQSITYVRVSSGAVTVPPAGTGGETAFVSRIDGLTAVQGS